MNLQTVKRVITGVISLAFIGGVIYLAFFVDLNLYVMDFMTSQGFHPDLESKDFTAIDGVVRIAFNLMLISMFFSIIIIAWVYFVSAINNTPFPGRKKNKNVSVDTHN